MRYPQGMNDVRFPRLAQLPGMRLAGRGDRLMQGLDPPIEFLLAQPPSVMGDQQLHNFVDQPLLIAFIEGRHQTSLHRRNR